jgi:O-antigen ligase
MNFRKTANKLIYAGHHMFLPIMDRSLYDWIKLGVILMVFAASIVLGSRAASKLALISAILIIGFIGFVFLLRRPEIGIILLIPISFFIPWEVGTGTNVTLNFTFLLAIAIIGIWIFKVITTRVQIYPQMTSINILSTLFIVATCISLLAGKILWVINARDQASLPAQVGGWLLYVIPIGIMLYVQNHFKDIRWLKILTWLFIGLGSIFIIDFFSPIKVVSRFNFFGSDSIAGMYWTWLAALVFGQFLFNKELRPGYKIALGLLTIAIITAGVSAGRREWLSGWLPPLIAIGTILCLRSWRLGLVAIVLVVIVIGISNFSDFTNGVTSTNQYSFDSRLATFPIMFKLIKANPIIGLGFANYYHYTSLYPIWGWYVSFNTHNNYMDIIAQTGFVGLVLFLCLMIGIGLYGWKLHKLELDGFCNGYINACLGGLVGMLASGMLADWFLPFLYNVGIGGFRSGVFAWIFIGGLLAIGRIIDQQEKGKTTPKLSYMPP